MDDQARPGKAQARASADEPRRDAPGDVGAHRRGTVDPGVRLYKNHINIDRRFGFIRRFLVTDAAAYDGHRLPALLNADAFDSRVWADTAYRSQANERAIEAAGRVSMVHFRKPRGRPMPAVHRTANRARSVVRAKVEHPFAEQKSRMGLFVRTIGVARAAMKIGLANLAYNFRRLVWHQRRAALG